MKTKKIATISIILLCLSSLLFFAGCKGKRHDSHHAFALDYIEDVLDLTSEQKTMLIQYKTEIEAKVQEMKTDHKDYFIFAKNQLASDQIDVAQTKQMVAQHRIKMDAIIDLSIDRLADFHKHLTAEQKVKLVEKMEKMEKHHKNWD